MIDDVWQTCAAMPPLEPVAVHVWRVPVARQAEPGTGILTADESVHAARFRQDSDRLRFMIGRSTLRVLLAHYTGGDARRLVLVPGPQGKPVLAAAHGQADVRFNVSHSGDWVLLAFARGRETGVDIELEQASLDIDALQGGALSPDERRRIAALHPSSRRREFFRLWTCKEAFLKATGHGLHLPLTEIDVVFDRDATPHLSRTPVLHGTARWELRTLHVADGYAACVAAEGPDFEPLCLTWPLRPELRFR